MSEFIVHEKALVFCSHLGSAEPTTTNPRVKINGMEAAMVPAPYKISGCLLPPPNAGNGPCVSAIWKGGSVRVLSNHMPFVLANSSATCAPTGTELQIILTQLRVKAS